MSSVVIDRQPRRPTRIPPTTDDELRQPFGLEADSEIDDAGKEAITVPPAKDRTYLPNWVMPIACTAFIGLLALVYQTTHARIDGLKQDQKDAITRLEEERREDRQRLERQVDVLTTYMKNSRELLIAHGWDISDEGKITKRK